MADDTGASGSNDEEEVKRQGAEEDTVMREAPGDGSSADARPGTDFAEASLAKLGGELSATKAVETSSDPNKESFRSKLVTEFHSLSERGLNANEAASLALKLACGAVDRPPDAQLLMEAIDRAKANKECGELSKLVSASFSVLEALSVAFLLQVDTGKPLPSPGIDFKAVRDFYHRIAALESEESVQALMQAIDRLLSELLTNSTNQLWEGASMSAVRPLLILLENQLFMEPEHHPVLQKLCSVLVKLPPEARKALTAELNRYPKEQLEQVVALIQQFLTISLYDSSEIGEAVKAATRALAMLYESNEQNRRVPYAAFYNDAVNNEDFNIKEDYQRWEQADRYDFSFCKFPFIYDPESKSRILHLDSSSQMSHQFEDALLRSFFMGGGMPFHVLRVRRDQIIADTIAQVQRRPNDLKKPLKVQFVGEDGVDEGGVQKEFFQLIVREIFDPKYGMFSYNEETRLFWFNSSLLELQMEYQLIGMVVGLAIYNGHILEFRFPNVIYKKLLGKKTTFSDLAEVDPGLAKGLQDLLQFQGDVQEIFCRNFQVSVQDMFGQVTTVDLKEGGGDIPVTMENRQEYVDLCVEFYLSKSIARPFEAFSRGFHKVCGGPVLQMFQPEELELLICGSTELDFEALEKATRYEDGYTKDSRIIHDFWQVVHSLSEAQKKRLLFFTTGSDRVPIKGLADLQFVISRNGPDSERLPTSHTCFNHLLLPEYSNFEKMKDRLLLAINNAEGFGLV